MKKPLCLILPLLLFAACIPSTCVAQDDEDPPPAPMMATQDIEKMDREYKIITENEAKNDALVQKLIVAKYKAETLVLETEIKELDEKDSSITLWLKQDSSFVLQCGDKRESGKWQLFRTNEKGYYLIMEDERQLSSLYPVLIRYDYDFENGVPRSVKSLLLPLDLPCETSCETAFFARLESEK
jgi:hypothetical protein